MSDPSDETIDIPTVPDGSSGIVIKRVSLHGAPAVALVVVVEGLGHRVTLSPREMLGVACAIGHVAELAGKEQNRMARLQGSQVAAGAEVLN